MQLDKRTKFREIEIGKKWVKLSLFTDDACVRLIVLMAPLLDLSLIPVL